MFITQAKEILEAVPTAKLREQDAQKLMRSVEEEEEQMLEPLLGERLMMKLVKDYKSLINEFGGITTFFVSSENVDESDEDGKNDSGLDAIQTKTIQLLRAIQSALVYRMLANKIYSLSTSINLGGGANRASAGDYEPADDKHMQELRREYYMNSRRMCDQILILLERDAKLAMSGTTGDEEGAPLWLSLWKDSEGYYLKEDLLFPTMRSLKPYYPCDAPTKFLSMEPVIRYCQDTYITPRVNEIDDTLIDDICDVSATLNPEQRKAQKLLRSALAYYILAKDSMRGESNAKEWRAKQSEAFTTAESAFGTAISYIQKHFSNKNVEEEDEGGKPCSKHGYESCNESQNKECGCEQQSFTYLSTLMPGVDIFG